MSRVGIGWDSHRLEEGRRLVLGGIEIAGADRGLAGYSDADVLTHALIDALLGAAGMDDIGAHFPDTEERWRNADSIELLGAALELIREAGLAPRNADVTVACEAPKLARYREDMRSRLAEALGLELGAVNVKFTTGERMGFVGRGEGIAALAVATLTSRQ